MRLTIVKRKRYRKKQRDRILIAVFVISPLITVALGYAFTKNIIVPYMNKETRTVGKIQEKTQTIKNENSSLNNIEMYSIEVDKFNSLEEAKNFIVKLNENERLGYISQGQDYTVYTGLTLDKKEVESQEVTVKEKYPQVMIRNVQTGEKKINIDSSEEIILKDMKDTVELLNNSYKKELSMWTKDIKHIEYDSLKDEIERNNYKIAKSMEKYNEKSKSVEIKSEDLTKLYSTLEKNIEDRRKILKEFDNKNIEHIRKTYYDFVESLFNYIKYYKI